MSQKKLQDLIESMSVEWEQERKELRKDNVSLRSEIKELKKIIFTFEKICKKVRTKNKI
tara:strand:+ start:1877 stop:2053 length:177 start_codon:yes stop_codon:yes gene_type:complete